MTNYRLYAVRIFSLNWDQALTFYRDILELPLTFSDSDTGWAQFQLGSAHLGLERCDATDDETQELVGRFVGLSLEVDDIFSEYHHLCSKGVEFLGKPEKQPWGRTLAHFRDPDGNTLTLLGM
jgi:catechol 2,3-dioxygenase-like lactoylglutathione lyase family enzyme